MQARGNQDKDKEREGKQGKGWREKGNKEEDIEKAGWREGEGEREGRVTTQGGLRGSNLLYHVWVSFVSLEGLTVLRSSEEKTE